MIEMRNVTNVYVLLTITEHFGSLSPQLYADNNLYAAFYCHITNMVV